MTDSLEIVAKRKLKSTDVIGDLTDLLIPYGIPALSAPTMVQSLLLRLSETGLAQLALMPSTSRRDRHGKIDTSKALMSAARTDC